MEKGIWPTRKPLASALAAMGLILILTLAVQIKAGSENELDS